MPLGSTASACLHDRHVRWDMAGYSMKVPIAEPCNILMDTSSEDKIGWDLVPEHFHSTFASDMPAAKLAAQIPIAGCSTEAL